MPRVISRVIGKQVRILYDLVTVFTEYSYRLATGICREGDSCMKMYEPGNLPVIIVPEYSRSRVIDCTYSCLMAAVFCDA